jgi:hypothetical protein
VVGLWFRGATRGIHQYAYGGLIVDAPPAMRGAYWHNLLADTVSVSRMGNDTDVEDVRLIVTHADPPDYDGWQAVDPAAPPSSTTT